MGRIITEVDLRSHPLPEGIRRFEVESDVFVTESARAYLEKRDIELVVKSTGGAGSGVMTYSPIADKGSRTYLDAATGRALGREKPEEMTHLRGNLLVSKEHPRILFRGKLDSMEAVALECQCLANREGRIALRDDLGSVLEHARALMAADVKEQPLEEGLLFGLGHSELRRISHNVSSEIGIQHPVPGWEMGELALALNRLRTQVRETELAAVSAFGQSSDYPRGDIIQELNRMSSGVYILFCRLVAGKY